MSGMGGGEDRGERIHPDGKEGARREATVNGAIIHLRQDKSLMRGIVEADDEHKKAEAIRKIGEYDGLEDLHELLTDRTHGSDAWDKLRELIAVQLQDEADKRVSAAGTLQEAEDAWVTAMLSGGFLPKKGPAR